MEARIRKEIAATIEAQRSASRGSFPLGDDPVWERQKVIEIERTLTGVASTVEQLAGGFNERFPHRRPKSGFFALLGHYLQKIFLDYLPYVLFAVILLMIVATRLHWPFYFRWFGYELGTVTKANDVRSVFLIP